MVKFNLIVTFEISIKRFVVRVNDRVPDAGRVHAVNNSFLIKVRAAKKE